MSESLARLFVALELATRSRTELARWATALAGPQLRPVDADALHVTLCFLGQLPTGEVPAIAGALGSVRLAATGPQAVLRSRWLPPRRPRVLAVELADPGGELGALQAAVARALETGGWYRAEARPYLPHVTVARVRAAGGHPRLEPPALAVCPESVALLRSHLGRGPARYERLAVWPIR